MKNLLLNKFEYFFPDWPNRIENVKLNFKKWRHAVFEKFFRLIIFVILTVISYAVLVFMVNYFWFTFKHTQVGIAFIKNGVPELIGIIFYELNQNLAELTIKVVTGSLAACLAVGFISQFISLRRRLYYGFGLSNRFFWWAICSGIITYYSAGYTQSADFLAGVIIHLVPVAFLLSPCMDLAEKLIPEISLIMKVKDLAEINRIAKIRNANWPMNR